MSLHIGPYLPSEAVYYIKRHDPMDSMPTVRAAVVTKVHRHIVSLEYADGQRGITHASSLAYSGHCPACQQPAIAIDGHRICPVCGGPAELPPPPVLVTRWMGDHDVFGCFIHYLLTTGSTDSHQLWSCARAAFKQRNRERYQSLWMTPAC